jgi:hypothetical protein
MRWTPIAEAELNSRIADGESAMSPSICRLWEQIRIRPTKWKLPPWGDTGGGFWVVAIMGERVIWFNDIEDGFNLSRYNEPGVIAEYWCNQDELNHTVSALMRMIETGGDPIRLGPPLPLS